jgi:UDP-N-acetylglucosamine 2-epimerase (non-hydrolysing)
LAVAGVFALIFASPVILRILSLGSAVGDSPADIPPAPLGEAVAAVKLPYVGYFDPSGLATLHRFEMITRADKYREALEVLRAHGKRLPVLYLVGAPERERIERLGLQNLFDDENFLIRPKLIKFLPLMARAERIVTDSGGLQEECAYIGVPCAIYRQRTGRQAGIGSNVLLTEMNTEKLQGFLDNYESQYHPSKIIVETLAELGYC